MLREGSTELVVGFPEGMHTLNCVSSSAFSLEKII